jgi:acyl carrier protein
MESSSQELSELKSRLKKLIVTRLKLEIEPESIDPSKPLFGQAGLGLDSIDALELVLGVEQDLGVRIDDEDVGSAALASVDALAAFVHERLGPVRA